MQKYTDKQVGLIAPNAMRNNTKVYSLPFLLSRLKRNTKIKVRPLLVSIPGNHEDNSHIKEKY